MLVHVYFIELSTLVNKQVCICFSFDGIIVVIMKLLIRNNVTMKRCIISLHAIYLYFLCLLCYIHKRFAVHDLLSLESILKVSN